MNRIRMLCDMNFISKKFHHVLKKSIHLDSQIIYNTVLAKEIKRFERKKRVLAETLKNEDKIPCSLKYYMEESELENLKINSSNPNYYKLPIIKDTEKNTSNVPSNWMSDYESFPEKLDLLNNSIKQIKSTPCGGCGSILQSQNSTLPGYLPKEILNYSTNLHKEICQRCHFLKHYNTALNITISSDDYPKVLSHIKDKRALVILMIDLLDYPCSFWPNVENIIGTKRPVILVGNKVDLLPRDDADYLSRISQTLLSTLNNYGLDKLNVKHVALISAKNGYGIENLITALHEIWLTKGDVYLMGCTNVGKSTLFNALIQSDYCKTNAIDMLQRATISQWPGTTLNLLKFPILRPSSKTLSDRYQRLNEIEPSKDLNDPSSVQEVGKTFYDKTKVNSSLDHFSLNKIREEKFGIDSKDFELSKWCYDTPGASHPDQLSNLLSLEELLKIIPQSKIIPKSFRMFSNWTLFLAGLARLDLLSSKNPIIMTVFASENMPVTICETKYADQIYKELLGTSILGIPSETQNLNLWPKLVSKHYSVTGLGFEKSAADIVFSSAGWISLTLKKQESAEFQAWTPNGKGLFLRNESLLPYCVNMKGPLIRKTPVYNIKYK